MSGGERLPVTELTGQYQGADNPFGDGAILPLPVEDLRYEHPPRPDLAVSEHEEGDESV